MAFAQKLRRKVGQLPFVGPAIKRAYRSIVRRPALQFSSSPQYWDDRYRVGGNSGAGSYGRLALFKAEILNAFVSEKSILSVIEFGSGDGAQLELARYPSYVGIDVSNNAVEICRRKFAKDGSKRFFHTSSVEAGSSKADLALSLDVLYHLVEDDIYHAYMSRLISASDKFVCVYSSNFDSKTSDAHVRHRCFSDWIARRAPEWKLMEKIPNRYPEDSARPQETSFADFYFFKKT